MCKNPLKRKVASQVLNVLAQFLTHYQHLCKKKKKVMRHPKVRREGTRNNFVFLCGLTLSAYFGSNIMITKSGLIMFLEHFAGNLIYVPNY